MTRQCTSRTCHHPTTSAAKLSIRGAALGTATALLASGCSAGALGTEVLHPNPAAAPSSSGSLMNLPPSPAAAAAVPSPARAAPDLEQVATQYLAARENANTLPHPRNWLGEVKALTTPEEWSRLARSAGDTGGFAAAVTRARHWSVTVAVACQTNPDAGGDTAASLTITCALTDRTTNADGSTVPERLLPRLWPYTGPQPPALIELRRTDNRWYVDQDRTGQAG